MDKPITVHISEWEFVFNGATEQYPLGYYLHKPTEKKYCYKRGITDIVGKKNEQKIYDMWWLTI